MKALIYAGIGLFSVASVYGIADYYRSQKNGDLKRLYSDEPEAVKSKPVNTSNGDTTAAYTVTTSGSELNKGNAKAMRSKVKRKAIRMEDFSRGRIDEVPVIPETSPEKVKEEMPEAAPAERKLSLEMFSRAPLKKMPVSASKKDQ